MIRIATLTIFLLCLLPTIANADDGYRSEIAVTDSIGAGLAVVGVGTFIMTKGREGDTGRVAGAALGIAGLWTILLGSPVIHLTHGQRADAALSLGLRTVVPMGSAYLGKLLCGPRLCSSFGATLGMIGGMTIDYWLLAGPDNESARPLQIGTGWSF